MAYGIWAAAPPPKHTTEKWLTPIMFLALAILTPSSYAINTATLGRTTAEWKNLKRPVSSKLDSLQGVSETSPAILCSLTPCFSLSSTALHGFFSRNAASITTERCSSLGIRSLRCSCFRRLVIARISPLSWAMQL
ncbi:hypothetical protein B0H63DRAFT_489806 [Podospora didyma]|uniref:Uncharacterized protein n=1 Tax=Podospora didyma TaxID=330526 RepID=A0AAE0N207_9PEZI|nr:hypothetical protein B0H63DRAFT_489806 [Podospora didyma]